MSTTVVDRFWEQASRLARQQAFMLKLGGSWRGISWASYAETVRRAAWGIRSLGGARTDKVALISQNRPEWQEADLAVLSLGAVTVPIYATSSGSQAAYIIAHSDANILFVEDDHQLQKIRNAKSDLQHLRKIIVFSPGDLTSDERVMTWEQLLSAGDAHVRSHPHEASELGRNVRPDDLATLMYTSGTTGPPKGVMLTHANIRWTCDAFEQVLPLATGDRRLSYLPLSHIAERVFSHFLQIWQGTETWFAQSMQTWEEDLRACRPAIFFGVPRIWEKVHSSARRMLEAMPAGDGAIAEVRKKLGLDAAVALLSGAAPINPDTLRDLHAIGLPVAEIYGQTEDCGPTALNRIGKIRIGTVGQAMPGVQIRIAADGEILVKGGNVTPGYYKSPSATAELFDDEGWMRSGDVGLVDDEGYLRITDRKKDLIITAAGHNVAPQVIENMLRYSPWIAQAAVIGDRRPYLVALITLDDERVLAEARRMGIAVSDARELVDCPEVRQLVEDAVIQVNAQLARAEQIKKWTVLAGHFTLENDEITPTLKLRRRAIVARHAATIEEMYRG